MTICRPIILHSEYLPAKTGQREWEYRAFGHYDGITVKENIPIVNYESLKPLFDVYLQSEEESLEYFSQTLACFHEKTEEEEGFWQKELPFLYLVLLQTSDGQAEECRRYLESREFLEKELYRLERPKQINDTFITVYYSLDNSDLIVVVKCGHADTGAALVDSLHRADRNGSDVRIWNSYSILGVRQSEMKSPSDVIEENAPVDRMEIRIVEGNCDLIDTLYHRLREELQTEKNGIEISVRTLLGTEDGVIMIRNLPWKLLLSLYRETTGILNNSNKSLQDYAYAVSSQIMFPYDSQTMRKSHVESATETIHRSICAQLIVKINEVYRNKRHAGFLAEKKNLIMFVKSMFRFENACCTKKEFSDYNFFALYLPFYTFVKLLGEEGGGRPEDYYDFMKSLRLRTQSFAKSDRVFFQVADFNMRYFDIPPKIIALYSAYIHYFKRALNTIEGKNYEFLVCPGMNSQIGVIELFLKKSATNRLFFIEIPEQEMYHLKQMFIMIGHEIAHFVGTDVRCRAERKEHLVNLCSRIVVLSMKSYLGYCDEFVRHNMDNLNFDRLESELREWIDFYIDREQDWTYLREYKYDQSITDPMTEKNLAYKDQFHEHSDVLRVRLVSAVSEMLLEHGQDIFGYIFQQEFYENEDCIGYENRESFLEEKKRMLQECIYIFTNDLNPENQALIFGSVMNQTLYLLKECYADMICILTLRLTLRDYLTAVAEIIDELNISIENLMDTELPARVAIVMTVISHSLDHAMEPKEGLFRWTDEEFNYQAAGESSIRKLENVANMFTYNYILGKIEISPEEMVGKSNGIIYDKKFLNEIIDYLLVCRERYFETLKKNKEKIQYVQEIYALSRMQTSGEFFSRLENLIARYEADVYTEMQKMMDSEE